MIVGAVIFGKNSLPSPNDYESSEWINCENFTSAETNEKCYQIIDEKIRFSVPTEWNARMSNKADLNSAPALILYSKNNDQSFEVYITYYGPYDRVNKKIKPKTEQALQRRLQQGLKLRDEKKSVVEYTNNQDELYYYDVAIPNSDNDNPNVYPLIRQGDAVIDGNIFYFSVFYRNQTTDIAERATDMIKKIKSVENKK